MVVKYPFFTIFLPLGLCISGLSKLSLNLKYSEVIDNQDSRHWLYHLPDQSLIILTSESVRLNRPFCCSYFMNK